MEIMRVQARPFIELGINGGFENLGHCSCYGPTGQGDRFSNRDLIDLYDLKSRGTVEWFKDYEDLYKEAIKLGF